jgi:hypothetical protein
VICGTPVLLISLAIEDQPQGTILLRPTTNIGEWFPRGWVLPIIDTPPLGGVFTVMRWSPFASQLATDLPTPLAVRGYQHRKGGLGSDGASIGLVVFGRALAESSSGCRQWPTQLAALRLRI